MGERACEDGGQNVSVIETNSSIDKSTIPPQKEGISGAQNSDCTIACVTPEKADEYLKGKLKEERIKLEEKYKTILEFFDCLTRSLRLLSLRKKLANFDNISCKVSFMTKREFLLKHLAQIAFIIPEAMRIDEVIVHDKKTSCMKPDMVISLQFDIVKGHSEHSDFLALRKVFSSRLMKYFVLHPEKSDVPEGALPESFNRRNTMSSRNQSSDNAEESQPIPTETDSFFQSSCLLPPSFKRYFSRKVASEAEISEPVASSVVELPSTAAACSLNEEDNNDNLPEDCLAQSISPRASASSSESPVVKPVTSSSTSIMTQTPAQSTPKRSVPSSDVKMRKTTTKESLYKPAKRFLNFSGMEGDNSELSFSVDDLQCYDIPQSKDSFASDENITGLLAASGKEEETHGEIFQEPSCLPQLVLIINHIFKSVKYYSITKEELMHKIIMHSLDITERREVEEQIEELEKLVPNWISRKLTLSGDVVFKINSTEDLESVVAKTVRI